MICSRPSPEDGRPVFTCIDEFSFGTGFLSLVYRRATCAAAYSTPSEVRGAIPAQPTIGGALQQWCVEPQLWRPTIRTFRLVLRRAVRLMCVLECVVSTFLCRDRETTERQAVRTGPESECVWQIKFVTIRLDA